MRDISLDEIAAVTKIGTRLLRALEEEQFELLPGGIFNKGYVRAYAKCVGIDEEQAVADYLNCANQAVIEGRATAGQGAASQVERGSHAPSSDSKGSAFPVVPILIVLIVIAGILGGWRLYRNRQIEDHAPADASPVHARTNDSGIAGRAGGIPATAQSNSDAAKEAGVAGNTRSERSPESKAVAPGTSLPATRIDATKTSTTLSVPGNNAESPQQVSEEHVAGATASQSIANTETGTPFELTVRPKDSAWVSIKSDGKYVVRGIIKPPDVKTIRASSEVVFYTGNAGAVAVSFNGKNVPLSGGANDERMLVFNSRGLLPQPAPQ